MEDFHTIGIVISLVYLVLGVTAFFALLSWRKMTWSQSEINEILLKRLREEEADKEED